MKKFIPILTFILSLIDAGAYIWILGFGIAMSGASAGTGYRTAPHLIELVPLIGFIAICFICTPVCPKRWVKVILVLVVLAWIPAMVSMPVLWYLGAILIYAGLLNIVYRLKPPSEPEFDKPCDPLAIVAIVFVTILSSLGTIPAIILGHISLFRLKRHPELGGKLIALTALFLGYACIVMFVLVTLAIHFTGWGHP
jgi:hypothetical protein